MKRYILATGLTIASISAQPAMAATYKTTYLGTITAGYDPYGVFGLDISLTDAPVKLAFVFDTVGAAVTSSFTSSSITGSNISSVAVTINGITKTITGYDWGHTYVNNDNPTDTIDQYVSQVNSYGNSLDYSVPGAKFDAGVFTNPGGTSLLTTAALNQGGTYAVTGTNGIFNFINRDSCNCVTDFLQGSFSVDSVTVSGVPEPTTWAMMVLGLAGIGLTLRQRRRATPLAGLAPAAV